MRLGLQASAVSGAANITPSVLPPQRQSWGERGGVPRGEGWKLGAKGLGMLSPCPGRLGAPRLIAEPGAVGQLHGSHSPAPPKT